MSIGDWLEGQRRDPSPSAHFEVRDVSELVSPDRATVEVLARTVVESKSSLEFLRDVAGLLGQEVVAARLLTERVSVRRGDFGEALAGAWLEYEDALAIPVRKGRHQILPTQTLPGVDLLALEYSGEEIVRLHLIETKLRTTYDNEATSEAYDQHLNRPPSDVNSLLAFVLQGLYEKDRRVYSDLILFLQARTLEPDDAYHVVSIYETDLWRDISLAKLDASAGDLKPLDVDVVRIAHLRSLIDDVFEAVGAFVLDDEPGSGNTADEVGE